MNQGIFLVCGDDDFLVGSAARALLAQFAPDAGDTFAREIIDGRSENASEVEKAVAQCIEAIQTPGFFGSSKVVWLRDANFLTGGERVSESETAKQATSRLVEVLKKTLPEGLVLIITTPKVLRSSVFFKTCREQGKITDFGSNLKAKELEQRATTHLATLLEEGGAQMDHALRDIFIRRVGSDTRLISRELEKLLLYIGDSRNPTERDVQEITCVGREAEAWDIIEAIGQRNGHLVIATLRRMSGQKGVGMRLAAMLEKSVREWMVLRNAYDLKWLVAPSGRPPFWSVGNLSVAESEMLESLPGDIRGMPGWLLRKKLGHALNYTMREWRLARHYLVDLREKLVSSSLPEMFLLETALLKIIGAKRALTVQQQSSYAGKS